MKKLYLLLLILSLMTILCACNTNETKEVEKLEEIELEFIELQKNNNYPKAIFASNSERTYYQVDISSYDYNNWELSKGDTIQVTKNVKGKDNLLSTYYIYNAVWDSNDIELIEIDYFNDNK